jgi:hypothetical protein
MQLYESAVAATQSLEQKDLHDMRNLRRTLHKPAVNMLEILYALISRHPEVRGKSLAGFAVCRMSADNAVTLTLANHITCPFEFGFGFGRLSESHRVED